jgi:hypothetical protein
MMRYGKEYSGVKIDDPTLLLCISKWNPLGQRATDAVERDSYGSSTEALFSFASVVNVSIAVIMKVQNLPPSVYSIVPLARQ